MTTTAAAPARGVLLRMLERVPPLNALAAPASPTWRGAALIAGVLFAIFLATAPSLLLDPDLQWHLRTGQDILAQRQFPAVDVYSYTMTGTPWIAKEWLSQTLYALVYALGGFTGMVLLALFAACLAWAVLFNALAQRLSVMLATILVFLVAFVCQFHLLARPHVLAWPVLMIFFAGLLRAAEKGAPPPFALAAVMVLWANLHGSFLLGLLLAPIFAAEALQRAPASKRIACLRGWSMFGVLCLLAPLLHPYGWGVYQAAGGVLGLGPALSLISEWRPQDFSTFNHFAFVLLLGLGGALYTGIKPPVVRIALILLLVYEALAHVRQESLAAFIITLLLGAPIAALSARPPQPIAPNFFSRGSVVMIVALASSCLMAVMRGPVVLPEDLAPERAVNAALAHGVTGGVLNEDQFGGYLIRRHIPTYMDSRAELFGQMHYRASKALALRDEAMLAEILEDSRIGWTLLPKATPLNARLDTNPGWIKIYEDDAAIVHMRRRLSEQR